METEAHSSEIHGTVDGKPAIFRIHEGQLSWTEARHDADAYESNSIPLDNVIAVRQSGSSGYSIYCTRRVDRSNEESGNETLEFELRIVSGLPSSLVQLYEQLGQPQWQLWSRKSDTPPKIHVMVSTGSGTGLASAVWKQLVQPFLDSIPLDRKDYTVHTTTSETSVAELVQNVILPQANEGVAQYILLLSGDGGIVDIVNTLLAQERSKKYKKPTISLLPLGTGNAMANSAGITGDNTMGLRTMLSGSPKEVSLFRAMFSPGARLLVNEGREERKLESIRTGVPTAYGAVVCSWGLHAGLVADSDTTEYRKFGAERFKMAAKEALFPSDGSLPHAYKGKVTIRRPGKDEWTALPRHEHGYILATLVSHLESGFTISPSSQPLDGKLMLVHFGHLSGQEAMDVMSKAYNGGKHVEDERVGYEEIEGLKIEFEEDDGRWRRVCLDGKIVRVEKGGWVEVRSGVEGVVDLIAKDA